MKKRAVFFGIGIVAIVALVAYFFRQRAMTGETAVPKLAVDPGSAAVSIKPTPVPAPAPRPRAMPVSEPIGRVAVNQRRIDSHLAVGPKTRSSLGTHGLSFRKR